MTLGIFASASGVAAPAAWDPGLATKAGWWDGGDPSDMTFTPSTVRITQWNDLSGNGRHLTHDGQLERRPWWNVDINNRGAVYFDGDESALTFGASTDEIDLTSGFTFFAVVEMFSNADFDRIMEMRRSATSAGGLASPNVSFAYRTESATPSYKMMARSDGVESAEITATSGPCIIHSRHDGSSLRLGINGTESAPVSCDPPALMRYIRMGAFVAGGGQPPNFGSSGFLHGIVGEIMVVVGSIPVAYPINSYFAPKWEIT